MNNEMDVAVCRTPGDLVTERRAIPRRQSGEVLIRVRRVGVCGTDLHIYAGNQPYIEYPRIPGHELAGEVVETDPGSAFSPGTTVCIMPYMSCGNCGACRAGKTNCCRNIQVLGVHRDGGLAEYLSVPERFVLDAGALSLDDAAMVEFLAIGRHAVARANVQPGQRIFISGAGAIGIGTAYFAKQAGGDVTICDMRAERLDFCRQHLGVNALQAGPGLADQLSDLSHGEFFDAVFDATGNKSAMEAGFGYVSHGGTYILVSIVSHEICFSDPEFHKREMTLMGSRNATLRDFDAVIAELASGRLPAESLRTHRSTLQELPARISEWAQPATGVIKAIVSV